VGQTNVPGQGKLLNSALSLLALPFVKSLKVSCFRTSLRKPIDISKLCIVSYPCSEIKYADQIVPQDEYRMQWVLVCLGNSLMGPIPRHRNVVSCLRSTRTTGQLRAEWARTTQRVSQVLRLFGQNAVEPVHEEELPSSNSGASAMSLFDRFGPRSQPLQTQRAEQGQLLKKVLLNCRVDSVSLYPTYRKPFDLIFERANSKNWSALPDDLGTFLLLGKCPGISENSANCLVATI
jgi:hypothetical protein